MTMRKVFSVVSLLSTCCFLALGSAPTQVKALDIKSKPAVHDIAEEWEGHFTMLLMLGAGSRVYETSVRADKVPWMTHFFSDLKAHFNRKDPNPEKLIAEGVKTIFLTTGHETQAEAMRKLGLKAYSIPIHDYPTFLDCVRQTAGIIGTEQAQERLKVFEGYWKSVMDKAAEQDTIAKKPRVLHIASLEPLLVDGQDSLIDKWIHLAGGENATQGIKGYLRPADWEQLMVWNPDLVIVESGAGDIKQLSSEAGRYFLKTHRTVRNPSGIHSWDRYGPETLLQIQWATDIIHNGKIDETVWIPKIQKYYQDIYGLHPTADDAHRMLQGLPPVK